MTFEDRITTQKGRVGEQLVLEWLESKGIVVYLPVRGTAHPFDKLCATRDKKHIFIAEVKTKPQRTFYPDTGINLSHYRDYRTVSQKHNMSVFIFFVDEDAGKVYGNWLRELIKPTRVQHRSREIDYPLIQGAIIYFPMVHMKAICDIDAALIGQLRSLSTRNYEYAQEATAA